MKVKNINGTADNKCNCSSWLEHWVKFAKQSLPQYCAEKSCLESPEVGAHVQEITPGNTDWFIVPLCKGHNGKVGETIEISDSMKLISANVSETCG